MKRGECRIDEPQRITKKLIDIETALPVPPANDFPESTRAGRRKTVAFAPLFDTCTTFKARESVQLRFRAREALSGIPIRVQDISFSLRQGESTDLRLPVSARVSRLLRRNRKLNASLTLTAHHATVTRVFTLRPA